MKIEALFLLFLGAFFGVVGLVYWFWGYEDGGRMMLVGTAAAGLPARQLLLLLAPPHGPQRRLRTATTPPSSEMGAGTIDSFPGSSIWPFVLGMGAFLTVLALVFGDLALLPRRPADPHRADRRHRREPAGRRTSNLPDSRPAPATGDRSS